MNKVDYKG